MLPEDSVLLFPASFDTQPAKATSAVTVVVEENQGAAVSAYLRCIRRRQEQCRLLSYINAN